MGWCSATDIFDKVAEFVLASPWTCDTNDEALQDYQYEVLKHLTAALEDNDWDCQSDSDYYEHPVVQRIMREFHPRWFEDESEGGQNEC